MSAFDLALRTSGSLHPDGEPTDFVSTYEGVIRCTHDEDGRTANVGRVKALRVHAGLAADYGESLFDVCDAHSQELHLLHTLLYEPDGHSFQDWVTERFHAVEADLLVLDYAVLAPRWRGLRLGLLAVRKLVDMVGGGCGLAVSEIAPLAPDAHELIRVPARWLPKNETAQSRREARRKLRAYYRRMGFERLGTTPYSALSLALVKPTLGELLKPNSSMDD